MQKKFLGAEIDLVWRKSIKFEQAFHLYSPKTNHDLYQEVIELVRGDH